MTETSLSLAAMLWARVAASVWVNLFATGNHTGDRNYFNSPQSMYGTHAAVFANHATHPKQGRYSPSGKMSHCQMKSRCRECGFYKYHSEN